jgi:hypothetical protein
MHTLAAGAGGSTELTSSKILAPRLRPFVSVMDDIFRRHRARKLADFARQVRTGVTRGRRTCPGGSARPGVRRTARSTGSPPGESDSAGEPEPGEQSGLRHISDVLADYLAGIRPVVGGAR